MPLLPSASAASPRRITLRWETALAFIVTLYLLAIVLPAYLSGLYQLSDAAIMRGTFSVPLYRGPWAHSMTIMGLLLIMAAWWSIPIAGMFAYTTFRARGRLPRHIRIRALVWYSSCVAIVCGTYPAAYAMITWLLD